MSFLSHRQVEILRQKMNKWNNRFPTDFFWRQHFNISFGSKEHQEMDIFDQEIWWQEKMELERLREAEEKKRVRKQNEEQGIVLDEIGDGELTDEEFENIKLEDFEDN